MADITIVTDYFTPQDQQTQDVAVGPLNSSCRKEQRQAVACVRVGFAVLAGEEQRAYACGDIVSMHAEAQGIRDRGFAAELKRVKEGFESIHQLHQQL